RDRTIVRWRAGRPGLAGQRACTSAVGMASFPAIHRLSPGRSPPSAMAPRTDSYFHLHLVSDATGETLITVARAAAAQYATVSPVEHMHPLVRTPRQLDRVLNDIENSPGIVLYTLLDRELANRLEEKCRALGLPFL